MATTASLRAYDIYWRDEYLGKSLVDTTQFEGKAVYVDLEVDQTSGIFAQTQTGFPAEVKATFIDTTVSYLGSKLLRGQVLDVVNGADRALFGGNRFIDMIAISGRLLMHPTGVDLSDQTNDITVFLAAPKLESFLLTGSRTKYQDVPVIFSSFPVEGAALGQEYWRLGPNISAQTPLYTILKFIDQATLEAPYIGTAAATLAKSANDRITAYIGNGTVPVVASALANGAITGTATTLLFDTAASDFLFQVGTVFKTAAGEFVYVSAVSYATSTSGTLTIVRGVGTQAGTGIAIADNDNLFIVAAYSNQNVRDTASYASSAPTIITVGNVYQTGTAYAQRKGVITNVNTGASSTSNVTATFNAVSSGNMVVTGS